MYLNLVYTQYVVVVLMSQYQCTLNIYTGIINMYNLQRVQRFSFTTLQLRSLLL
jgi:hypothetical protein